MLSMTICILIASMRQLSEVSHHSSLCLPGRVRIIFKSKLDAVMGMLKWRIKVPSSGRIEKSEDWEQHQEVVRCGLSSIES